MPTYPRTDAEIAAGVTPTDTDYPAGNIIRYGADNTGSSSSASAVTQSWQQYRAGGVAIYAPSGIYKIDSSIAFYAVGASNFGQAAIIYGDGAINTIFDNQVANGPMFDFGVSAPVLFASAGRLSDFQIATTNAQTASTGIRLKTQYNMTIDHVTIIGLSGDGIQLPESGGDDDANAFVEINQCRIFDCGGWGINGIPADGFNQNGFTRVVETWVQNCGTTMSAAAISAITNANPAVVTATAHGFSSTQYVYIHGVLGALWANGIFQIASATTNTFQLVGVDSTALAAFTSGGKVRARVPTSGGMAFCVDTLEIDSCGLTINKNVGLALGNASSLCRGANVINTDFENNGPVQVQCTNIDVLRLRECEILNAVANPAAHGLILDGSSATMRNIDVDGTYVRANPAINPTLSTFSISGITNANPAVVTTSASHGFSNGQYVVISGVVGATWANSCTFQVAGVTSTTFQLSGVNSSALAAYTSGGTVGLAGPHVSFYQTGGNVAGNTVRVRNTSWSVADFPLQSRFTGPWLFDPVALDCELSYASNTALVLKPRKISVGNSTPLRLRGPVGNAGTLSALAAATDGEWTTLEIPSSGATGTISGPAASTLYYVYLQDVSGVPTLIYSTTSFVIDTYSGYPVKSDDATAVYVGSWATDGSSHFVTARTVKCLIAASLAGAGGRDYVTDSTQTLTAGIGATVAGGGANYNPVTSNGTNWLIG